MKPALLISCEHGAPGVPEAYAGLFQGAEDILAGHEGWDPGAAELAEDFARAFAAPLFLNTTTRLLVDANRSEHHPKVFSAWSRRLTPPERTELLERIWRAHRGAVEEQVRAFAPRPVLHVSVHSFTPIWSGVRREVDIGLLYDPRRNSERQRVSRWIEGLRGQGRPWRVRRNQPYRGTSDGLPKHLRGIFCDGDYAGIEVEVSQGIVLGPASAWAELRGVLVETLGATLA